MATLRRVQTSFSAGSLDPRLKGRKDVGLYYAGCDELLNCLVRPQGSAQTRPGLLAISASFGGTAGVRLAPFVFNSQQRYLVVFSEEQITVYDAATNAQVSILATSILGSETAQLDFVQIADTMLVVHQNHQISQLQRQINGTFTWGTYTFERSPKYRYQPRAVRLQASATTGVVTMTCPDGPAFRPGYEVLGEAAIKAAAGAQWAFRGVPFTIQSVADDGLTAQVEVNGTFPAIEASIDWVEQASSTIRGRFRSIAYFQGRLWLGGTRDAPTQIWASRAGAPYDFYATSTNDDDPFDFEMSGGRLEPILHMVPGSGGLEVYTTGDEAIIPGNDAAPITPKAVSYVPQSAFGSRPVKPVRLNSNTVFVQRAGGVLRENIYSEAEQAYLPQSLSVRSVHILSDPARMTAVPGGFGLPLDFIVVVNGDGTAAIMTSERAQEVAAWAPLTVPGRQVLDVCAVADAVYAAYIGEQGIVWIGKFDVSARFDAERRFTFETPTATLAGLDEFAGEQVHIWTATGWRGSKAVSEAGTLTLDEPVTAVTIGLLYDWRIRPMPPELEQDSLLGRKIRPVRAEVRFLATASLRVNGQIVHDRSLIEAFESPPIARTGVKRVQLMGWSNGEQCPVVLTREGPFPIEVIALAVDYRVGGG